MLRYIAINSKICRAIAETISGVKVPEKPKGYDTRYGRQRPCRVVRLSGVGVMELGTTPLTAITVICGLAAMGFKATKLDPKYIPFFAEFFAERNIAHE